MRYFLGSNPHSNGDLFYRSSLIFFEINAGSIIIADGNRIVIIAVVIIIIIITYLVFHKFLDWKSSIQRTRGENRQTALAYVHRTKCVLG